MRCVSAAFIGYSSVKGDALKFTSMFNVVSENGKETNRTVVLYLSTIYQ